MGLLFVFIFCRLVGCQPADWIYCPSFQLLPDSTVVPRVSLGVVLYRAMALRAAALLLTVLLAALLIRDVDAAVNKPKLKWKHGGCLVTYAVWCDYGILPNSEERVSKAIAAELETYYNLARIGKGECPLVWWREMS